MGSNKNEIDKLKDSEIDIEKEDMSSRVKNMLKSDKEAIRRMREQMAKLEEDDELDYLDDEKIDMPVIVKDTDGNEATDKGNEKNSEDVVRAGNSKTTNNKKNRKNKNNRKEDKSANNKKEVNKGINIEKITKQDSND